MAEVHGDDLGSHCLLCYVFVFSSYYGFSSLLFFFSIEGESIQWIQTIFDLLFGLLLIKLPSAEILNEYAFTRTIVATS